MLSERFLKISSLISKNKNNIICDIGTDHCKLPIYLILNNYATFIYATDINKNPLKQAKININNNNLNNKIKLIQSDGLTWIKKYLKIDYCIIAGIGSKTILSILKKDQNLISKYIICPNNNEHLIRKWIRNKNYFIKKEIFVLDNNIIYPIILIDKNKGLLVKNDEDEIFGSYFLNYKTNNLFIKYWKNKINNINYILAKIENKNIRKMNLLLSYKKKILKILEQELKKS